MDDRFIANIVNTVRDIAINFHTTEQLRARIAHVLVPQLKRIADLEAQLSAARCEAAEAQASEQKLRRLLVALVAEQSESISPEPENHPDHGHEVVGVWDDDNGEIAGKPCALCAIWNAAKAESLGVATNSGTALAAAIKQAVAPYREGAERYQYIRSRVSAGTRKTFHFEGIVRPLPASDLWRGSVANHLDAAIDAVRKGGV